MLYKKNLRRLSVEVSESAVNLILSLHEIGAAMISEILDSLALPTGPAYRQAGRQEIKPLKENSARTILWRLEKKGLVKKKEKYYRLTSFGLKIVKICEESDETPTAWDGKWRIAMFDIPERLRTERDWLRSELLFFDYQPLQKSVFIGKRPLDDELYQEITERHLEPFLRLMTVGEIDDEDILRT